MLKDIKAQEVINSSLLIREPVEDLSKKIEQNSSEKIILTGGRGTGKSIILTNIEKRNIGQENQTIYMSFDSIGLFSEQYDETFTEEVVDYYYEIKFCWKILNYIKKYYTLTYETYFKEIAEGLENESLKIDNYINNSIFEKINLDYCLKPTELSIIILELLKKYLGVKNITLAIDRFDWTNNRSELVQKTLTKFFNMFDKVIITTDDVTLQDKNNQKRLLDNGFSFEQVNYGNNDLIIRYIIKKRIEHYNNNLKPGEMVLLRDIISDDDIKYLANNANGNISFILDCVRDEISEWIWTNGNCKQSINEIVERRFVKTREIERMGKIPKLYL